MRGAVIIGDIEKSEGLAAAQIVGFERDSHGDGSPMVISEDVSNSGWTHYEMSDGAVAPVKFTTYGVTMRFEGDDEEGHAVSLCLSTLVEHLLDLRLKNPGMAIVWRKRITAALSPSHMTGDEGEKVPLTRHAGARARLCWVPVGATLVSKKSEIA